MSEITVPNDLWDDDSEGVIATWLYEHGANVEEGTIIAEVMNEKISFDILAPASGTLEIGVEAEGVVKQGQVIGRIAA